MTQHSLLLRHAGPALDASLADAGPDFRAEDAAWSTASVPAHASHAHAAAVRRQRGRSLLAFVTLLAMMAATATA